VLGAGDINVELRSSTPENINNDSRLHVKLLLIIPTGHVSHASRTAMLLHVGNELFLLVVSSHESKAPSRLTPP